MLTTPVVSVPTALSHGSVLTACPVVSVLTLSDGSVLTAGPVVSVLIAPSSQSSPQVSRPFSHLGVGYNRYSRAEFSIGLPLR